MSTNQTPIITTVSGRNFDTFAAAIVVVIINEQEEMLLLNSPKRPGWWEVVNGAIDAGDTVLSAALREVGEEAGEGVRVRPLGVMHVSTFTYDPNVTHMIGITYLMAYQGGEIAPGDDMQGSQFRWCSLADIERDELKLLAPLDQAWLRERAIELYRLWREQPDYPLQRELNEFQKNKYDLTAAEGY